MANRNRTARRHPLDEVLADLLDRDETDGMDNDEALDDGFDHDGDWHGSLTDFDPDNQNPDLDY